MNGLTLQSRLVLVVVLALQKLETKPTKAVMLCDSRIAISATKSKRKPLENIHSLQQIQLHTIHFIFIMFFPHTLQEQSPQVP